MTLAKWLDVATADLAPPAAERIREELQAHVQDAIEAGQLEDWAVQALGDPAAAARHYRRTYLGAGEWAALGQIHPLRFGPVAYWLPVPCALGRLVVGMDSEALRWTQLGVVAAWLLSVPLTQRLDGSLRFVMRALIGLALLMLTNALGAFEMSPLTWREAAVIGGGVVGSVLYAVHTARYLHRYRRTVLYHLPIRRIR